MREKISLCFSRVLKPEYILFVNFRNEVLFLRILNRIFDIELLQRKNGLPDHYFTITNSKFKILSQ